MHALVINEQGTAVHLEGELLLLSIKNNVVRKVRLAEIDEVLLFGRIELSNAAIHTLARRGVDILYLTLQGKFRARITGHRSTSASLRLEQLRRANDPDFCAAVTRAIVAGKITHQRNILLRAQRKLKDEDLANTLARMRMLLDRIPNESNLDVLRGLEGMGASFYFSQFGKLIADANLAFHGRSRRPPADPPNACLSFGYSILTSIVESETLRCGFEPNLGFFHQPHSNRPSLALDLVEEFRPFVDTLTVRLFNLKQLAATDFEIVGGPALDELLTEPEPDSNNTIPPQPHAKHGVYLNETGRKIFLKEFYSRLREKIMYPPRDGSFELRDIIREQIYLFARVIRGENDTYSAFVPS